MKYVILKNGHICRSQIDCSGYTFPSQISIFDDLDNKTGFYLMKIGDEFADLFVKCKKFDKDEVKPLIEKAKLGTLLDSEIIWE